MGSNFFLTSSFFCGIASSALMIIFWRIIQGFGSALILANSLVIIIDNSPTDVQGNAVGKCIAIASSIGIFGPAISGIITYFFGWRFFFLANIPFGIISGFFIISANLSSKTSARTRIRNIDWPGFFIFSTILAFIVIFLMQAGQLNWNISFVFWIFSILIVLLTAFILIENRSQDPLIPLTLFKKKKFILGNIILFLIQICDISSSIFWVYFLQNILGYSVIKSGLLILPLTLPGIYFSSMSGRLFDKFGPGFPIILGTSLVCISFIWIANISNYKIYWLLLPSFLLHGIGESLIIPAITTFLISSVDSKDYGLASGIANTMRQVGGAIGLSLISSSLLYLNTIFNQNNSLETRISEQFYTPANILSFNFVMYSIALIAFFSLIFALLIFKFPFLRTERADSLS